ncbi:MAG: M15 family metallopeptidase [Patescibacteria group bacterium]
MFKKTIKIQSEVIGLDILQRSQYYLDRSLYNSKNQYLKDEEELIQILPSDKLKIEPFWLDQPLTIEDQQLSQLLDLEGRLMRQYILDNPNFGVELRESVAQRIIDVSNQLPDNYQMVLKIGYRPVSVQYQLFDEVYKYFHSINPDSDENELKKQTLEFVTHPDINTPPHSTGAAIDLTLFDLSTNSYIDMGSPINSPDDQSWTYNFHNLTEHQIQNRNFLTQFMLKAGFCNLASEWWHYSYGDSRWAVFYNSDSHYGQYKRKNTNIQSKPNQTIFINQKK